MKEKEKAPHPIYHLHHLGRHVYYIM